MSSNSNLRCLSGIFPLDTFTAINPIDGRYAKKTEKLRNFFSEHALNYYRTWVEIEYLIFLLKVLNKNISDHNKKRLRMLCGYFNQIEVSGTLKMLEKETNHDVEAVKLWIKNQLQQFQLGEYPELVHFGLTSYDINSVALSLQLKDALTQVIVPELTSVIKQIESCGGTWKEIPMLARTHGQPASPTTLGKEFQIFSARLMREQCKNERFEFTAKFGGATGNLNAHVAAYPDIDWKDAMKKFIHSLGLEYEFPTTQIPSYDNVAELCDSMKRITTILIDMCSDIWDYISRDYFKLKLVASEVGSSAMPHKVNPIDFENAEGNFEIARMWFEFFARKLPKSRLQRDLTDSTVTRNIGVPLAHMLIACKSLRNGLSKLEVNQKKIEADLDANWQVVAEAYQTILRRDGYTGAYNELKELTRGQRDITQQVLHKFVDELQIDNKVKDELKAITPFNYIGVAANW